MSNNPMAFPSINGDPSYDMPMHHSGMSLRDWFAGQALCSGHVRTTMPDHDLRASFGNYRTGIRREEILAADAYRLADAMLAERAKEAGK